MEKFLESSSIHGFGHIGTAKRLWKVFWITVVILGFIGASDLIYESFRSWEESPITTTIETRPLAEITFPTVTVCPPKNTFTNLNYDLVMTSNITLDNATRKDFIDYSFDVINDFHFEELMRNLSMFPEKGRFNNWYHGHTLITLPYFYTGSEFRIVEGHLKFKLETSATSGVVSTQYFGDDFNTDKVVGNIAVTVTIFVPRNEDYAYEKEFGQKMSLYCEIEKESIEHVSTGYDKFKFAEYGTISPHEKYLSLNYTPARKGVSSTDKYYQLVMERIISREEMIKKNLNTVPGFQLKWYYQMFQKIDSLGFLVREPRKTQPKFVSHARTIEFIRLVNLLNATNTGVDKVWEIVKNTRRERMKAAGISCPSSSPSFIHDGSIKKSVNLLLKTVGLNVTDIAHESVPNETLDSAAKMFIYLNFCPKLLTWRQFMEDLFANASLQTILRTLNRMVKGSAKVESRISKIIIAKKLLDRLNTKFNLKYNSISSELSGDAIEIQDQNQLHTISNHPVHIIDDSNNPSPSSFIPFCEFGGNMSAMGVRIEQFDVPVCNSFKPKVLRDQLCYEVDPNKYINPEFKGEILKSGLTFLIDHNEDVQIALFEDSHTQTSGQNKSLVGSFSESVSDEQSQIYLGSIEPTVLNGEGEYNLNVVKQVKVKDSYVGLDESVRGCQIQETYDDCTTQHYLEEVQTRCGCVPFNIRSASLAQVVSV